MQISISVTKTLVKLWYLHTMAKRMGRLFQALM